MKPEIIMKTSTILILALLSGTLTSLSAAEISTVHDPGVNARQQHQQRRIHEGIRTGQLTKAEAKALKAKERALRREERQFKADGKLTPAERAKLHADLNQTSRDIYREKHDAETRTQPGVTPSH
jgi:Skp family chaperone for outer membrane proteins